MKKGILFILVIAINFLNAQKVVKKSIEVANVDFFQIDLTNCFNLILETVETNILEVEAVLDGEYRKDVLLNVIEEGKTVLVATNFQPGFTNPNDKLSAHKVVSVGLKIKIPSAKNVKITGGSCNTLINGVYKDLNVLLTSGKCTLNKVSENVSVNTQSGQIVTLNSKGTIEASSKYGQVIKEIIPIGNTYIKLMSITGDIYLKKTE